MPSPSEHNIQAWAEPIDLGVTWSVGAPLPHVVSNGSTAVLICYADDRDPAWDGTQGRVVSPNDPTPSPLLEFVFHRCHSVKFGGPNDEALDGHPLASRGLKVYAPHVVHHSPRITSEALINSAHPYHRADKFDCLNHYLFTFHDEMFEALAEGVSVNQAFGSMSGRLTRAALTVLARS